MAQAAYLRRFRVLRGSRLLAYVVPRPLGHWGLYVSRDQLEANYRTTLLALNSGT